MSLKKAFTTILIGIAFLPLCVTAAQGADIGGLRESPYKPVEPVGVVLDPSIDEASGLAASCKNENILWVINDGGNPPVLYAISPDGETVCEFRIEGAQNIDWEDMASFRQDNRDFLMVADVGDNGATREFCSLYVVEEPDIEVVGEPVETTIGTVEVAEAIARELVEGRLEKVPTKKGNSLNLSWRMKFRYEDGPRDCEAVAVDPQRHTVLLLSKRTRPPVLYELPLGGGDSESIFIARPIAGLTNIPPPSGDDPVVSGDGQDGA